jgi:hypothetical protein
MNTYFVDYLEFKCGWVYVGYIIAIIRPIHVLVLTYQLIVCLNTSTYIPSCPDRYNPGNRLPTGFERFTSAGNHWHSLSSSFISLFFFGLCTFSNSFTFLNFPPLTLPSSNSSFASFPFPPFTFHHYYSSPCLIPSFPPSHFSANFEIFQTCSDI